MERYLTLAKAGAYCLGKEPSPATARWARRHLLSNVPHCDLAGVGAKLFTVEDIDSYLRRCRVVPAKPGAVVARIMRPGGAR